MFVNQDWINNLLTFHPSYVILDIDLRYSGSRTFQALTAFCELANRTISDSLIQFSLDQYVSPTVTPFELFQSQIKAFIRQFRSTTTNNFLLLLDMIRNTNQANALLSAILTNYDFSVTFFTNIDKTVHAYPKQYCACSCTTTRKCVEQFYVYSYLNATRLYSIPGIYRGCYTVEALLQSTLECFYDEICANQFHPTSVSSIIDYFTSLDPSLPSEYSVDSTIQELLNGLMIEEWNLSITYNTYYNECQPIVCTYTYETKNGIVYIITVLFGLSGGLITALEFVVPILVNFVRRKKQIITSENGKKK
jgi:hypothetical protein